MFCRIVIISLDYRTTKCFKFLKKIETVILFDKMNIIIKKYNWGSENDNSLKTKQINFKEEKKIVIGFYLVYFSYFWVLTNTSTTK